MTEILATGTTGLPSSDFTIAAGSQVLFHLKNAVGPDIGAGARILLQIKTGSLYFTMHEMNAQSPGTVAFGGEGDTLWRALRIASPDPAGLERV